MPNAQTMVKNLFDAWNSHNVEHAAKFYADTYRGEDVSQAAPHIGKEGIRNLILSYVRAFPDFEISAEETIEQGNRIVVSWSARGTHLGKWMNIPATGQRITARGATILTLENDQITHARYLWDVAAVLREIGLLPEL